MVRKSSQKAIIIKIFNNMKQKFFRLFALICILVQVQGMNAQVFSKMSEDKRNAKLEKMALKVYYASKFAKYNVEGNYGKARVSSYTIKGKPSSESTHNLNVGQLQYEVFILIKGKFGHPYEAARVVFSDKLGIPWFIEFLIKDRLIFDRWDSPEAFK